MTNIEYRKRAFFLTPLSLVTCILAFPCFVFRYDFALRFECSSNIKMTNKSPSFLFDITFTWNVLKNIVMMVNLGEKIYELKMF